MLTGDAEREVVYHAEWFFRAGERRPRWLGYKLGYG